MHDITLGAGRQARAPMPDVRPDAIGQANMRLRTAEADEHALDEVLAESFPASDPPSWNPGTARPAPAG